MCFILRSYRAYSFLSPLCIILVVSCTVCRVLFLNPSFSLGFINEFIIMVSVSVYSIVQCVSITVAGTVPAVTVTFCTTVTLSVLHTAMYVAVSDYHCKYTNDTLQK